MLSVFPILRLLTPTDYLTGANSTYLFFKVGTGSIYSILMAFLPDSSFFLIFLCLLLACSPNFLFLYLLHCAD